jgi:hypothetical protein
MGLDAMIFIVLTILLPLRDNPKCYRFTPPVSNRRMFEGLSVDVLCGFGAKNLKRCTEFIQLGVSRGLNESLFLGHSSSFGGNTGSLMVHFGEKCLISGRVGGRL